MEIKLVAPPNDSMWWILRPEFIGFLDKIVIDKTQFEKEEKDSGRSGYHSFVWDRLTVLADENILEIEDIDIDSNTLNSQVSQIVDSIYNDQNNFPQFIDDMVFAYQYWISFNQMKVNLLPEKQQYRKEIIELLPIWNDDLLKLQSPDAEVFLNEVKIKKYVVNNIIEKVVTLKNLNNDLGKCAFASLKEYEPFVKYIDKDINVALATERTALTSQSKLINNIQSIDLQSEPEYEFLKFNLSQTKFRDILKNTFDNYKEARIKLKELVSRTDDITYCLSENKIDQSVTDEFLKVSSELQTIFHKARNRSKNLSKTFSGLSLVPIPIISQMFGLLGMGANKISEYVESYQLAKRGIKPNGLSAYYGFLESLIDINKLEKFPEVVEINKNLDSDYFEESFWRV